MLFSLTGASGAGKSTVLAHLQDVDWGVPVRCIDTDALTPAEVARSVEEWVRRELSSLDAP